MLRRRHRSPRVPLQGVDLATLDPRWRSALEEILASRNRLSTVVEESRPGPIQERLSSLVARVDAGVAAAGTIALRAQAASRTLASMDLERVLSQLKEARRGLARAQEAGTPQRALETEVKLLADQHAALSHLANALEEAAHRLRVLDLRLDAAVARAAQIVLRPDAVEELGDVDRELSAVVEELDAVRAGLDAAGAAGP